MASIVFGGMALAAYFSVTRMGSKDACRPGFGNGEAWNTAYQSPSNWLEALYMFAEALRYSYKETFGKWRTGDLLLGLVYLARRDAAETADSKVQGRLLDVNDMPLPEAETRLEELRDIRRTMQLCMVTRFRKVQNIKSALDALGLPEEAVLLSLGRSALLKPLFLVVKDEENKVIYVLVRGTTSIRDLFTTLTVKCKPHHVLGPGGNLVLGWSHFGMLASARWIHSQAAATLNEFLGSRPDWRLQVVGHSLGGGTAALLCTLCAPSSSLSFRDLTWLRGDPSSPAACARAVSIACPSCATKELSAACAPFVTSVVHGTDFVPTMNEHTLELLRQEVMASSWFDSWRRDMRASSMMYRVAEGGMRAVGQGTMWTVGAVAGVGRVTTRVVTSCVAARPRSAPPSRSSSLASRAGSTHLAGDSAHPQPPSLTFAVQRHGATRGSDSATAGASTVPNFHHSLDGATASGTTSRRHVSTGGSGTGAGSSPRARAKLGLFSGSEVRGKARTSNESSPVPLLDTRRGGRSDSGPDLPGFATTAAAAQAAAQRGERRMHRVSEGGPEEEAPGLEWRSWQAWGRQWWVRPDPLADRSARSAPPGQVTERTDMGAASVEEASHLLQETDLERFKMLEAMLDEEEEARHTSTAGGTPAAHASQLAQAVLGEPAVAGMHAAALDFSAALYSAAPSVDGGSGNVSPLANTAAMHVTPWPGGHVGDHVTSVAPLSARMRTPDTADEDDDDSVDDEDEDDVTQTGGNHGVKNAGLGSLRGGIHSDVFERGLSEDIVAYRKACENAEHERRRVNGASSAGRDWAAGGVEGGSAVEWSSEVAGGASPGDGEEVGDEAVQAVGEVGSGRYTKLYPIGRVMHIMPVELLGPADALRRASLDAEGAARLVETEGSGGEGWWWWSGRGTGVKGGDGKGISSPRSSHSPRRVGSPVSTSPRVASYKGAAEGAGERLVEVETDKQPLIPVQRVEGASSSRLASDSAWPILRETSSGVPQGPTHVLIDDIPVERYKKISLCRTMLWDHLLWRYLAAWDCVVADWEAKLEGPANVNVDTS